MFDAISLLTRKQMTGRKTVLVSLHLNRCQNVDFMRLCLMSLMPLLPAGIRGARGIHHGSIDDLIILGR